MKVGIYTLGCKVNTYESEYVRSLFINRGYEISDFNDVCDIYVINTCTVTNQSDNKSAKIIRSARRKNPNACIVGMGCHMQHLKNTVDVDVAIGNYNKSLVVDLVERYLSNKESINVIGDITEVDFEDMEIKDFVSRTRAFIKIEDGCNNFCSYCIIPYVRGRCRSKKFDVVLREVNSLVSNGFKEIVLTGIHTGNYGKDINRSFSELLEEILKIDKLLRIRISSIEITELDDKFFELLKNDKLCNHLHIPLQSGCDKVLKLMNRKYDTKYFLDVVDRIRKLRPDISLTTDVIVGFPNEDDNDFLETVSFVKKVGFSKIHVFPYSKRDGTVASRMEQIDEKIKKERVKVLLEVSNDLKDQYEASWIGKNEKVLIEKKDNYSYGHTSNYLYLKLDGGEENEILDVTITKEMLNDE